MGRIGRGAGPATWRRVRSQDGLRSSSPLACLRGLAAGALRDFTVGEALIDQLSACADEVYAQVCRASLLEQEDRYAEALGICAEVLETNPTYVPAVEFTSHLLTLLDRDQEAMELLSGASAHFESGSLVALLYVFQMELKQYDPARKTLDRWIALSPLAEKGFLKWLEAQRSELAYHFGDYDAAIRHAEASGQDFFKDIAQRLAEPARRASQRIELPVGFVKQHRMTCVPATLSAISRFWSKPADHVQVAEEILLQRHVRLPRTPMGLSQRLDRAGVHGDGGVSAGDAEARRAVHLEYR